MTIKTLPNRLRHCGFTMVETLVALVVLSVGMLGVAALYVTTLRSGSSAISRMQAVNLASDLADRIRANPLAGAAYAGAAADNGCIGGTTSCSANDMAATDLFYWQNEIGFSLPSGAAGTVTYTAGPPNQFKITVTWSEPGTSAPLSYDLRMQI